MKHAPRQRRLWEDHHEETTSSQTSRDQPTGHSPDSGEGETQAEPETPAAVASSPAQPTTGAEPELAEFAGTHEANTSSAPLEAAAPDDSQSLLTAATDGTSVSPPDTSPETAADAAVPKLAGRSVYIIDAHGLIYQVFHALPEMASPAGEPVGAVHGFVRDVLDLIEKQRPDYLFCAFDPAEPTFRHEMYEPYKVHREEMPADLRVQLPAIRDMVAALGVPIVERVGFEADDVMATLARQVERAGGRCVLVTNDKDCRQLLSERVVMMNLRKQDNPFFGPAELLDDWGIRPDQVVDFQSLVGDSVDNVPGVPLIGPKLARQLLSELDTLDAVLAKPDAVTGKKRRANLVTYREQALLSRDLVRLSDSVALDIDWSAAQVGGLATESSLELCRRWGFRRLADRIRRLSSRPPSEGADGDPGDRSDRPPLAATAVLPPLTADYELVASDEALRAEVARLAEGSAVAVALETTHSNPMWADVVGVALCGNGERACYVPLKSPLGDPQLDASPVWEAVRPLLEDPQIAKIGHDLKYLAVALLSRGVRLAGLAFDTMVADYLLEAGDRNHDLEELGRRYLKLAPVPRRDVLGSGRRRRTGDQVMVATLLPLACQHALIPWRLRDILAERLEEEGLRQLHDNLELPLVEVLAEMEVAGVAVDCERLAELGRGFAAELETLQAEIHALAGRRFVVDSPKQLAQVLFEDLKLPVKKRTKTGPSTDADVLSQLADEHPLPALVVRYRHFAKLKGTYVDALRHLVHAKTGRVHTCFRQDVAATGRLSSVDPNLQNIPVRTEEGRRIRSAFRPGPAGWQLVTADYSQIELRVLAHYCRDESLCRAFAEDQDIHALVASQVNGVPLAEVTGVMRRAAKAVNFGVIYGQSPFGLAKALQIDKEEAAEFIDRYFQRYIGVDAFMAKTLDGCRQKGYVTTILGRRRVVHGVRSPSRRGDSRQRNLAERIAINTVIQGSAADLIKQAMLQVRCRLLERRLQARMLLQIHDELLFEVPPREVSELSTLLVQEMNAVGQLSVPLKTDVRVGDDWASTEGLTPDSTPP